MAKELSKVYMPQEVEDRLYATWEQNGYFTADNKSGKESFTVVIPPPNVTGQLHMGHAMDETYQDILTRYKKLRGYEALWLPGTDHAGIATQAKVEEMLQGARPLPLRSGPREVSGACVGVEGEIRQHHHQPAQKAGLGLRLDP